MQRKLFVFLVLLISIFTVTSASSTVKVHSIVAVISPDVQKEVIEFQIATHILDIFQNNRTAKVKVFLSFVNFPYNATQVNAIINGTGGTEVAFQCKTNGDQMYSAESNITTWFLIGYGESYPFDSYEMYFNLKVESVHFLSDNSSYRVDSNDVFNLTRNEIFIPDPERRFLRDTWWITTSAHSPTSFIVNVQRNWQPPTLKLILPIIACFYFLGGTMFISRKDLQSRMTAYISLFVFAPVFLMTIQNYLPYRSSLCLPEVLLTLLLTSTATYAVFSMWPEDHILIPIKNSRAEIDGVAVLTAIILFLVIYLISLYLAPQMFVNFLVAGLLLLSLFGYFFGWFFVKRRYIDTIDITESFSYGFLIGGYVLMLWGIFLHNWGVIFGGSIFSVLGIVLFVISRWLRKKRPRRPPFSPVSYIV